MINNKDTTFTNKVRFDDKVTFNKEAQFDTIKCNDIKLKTSIIQALYNSSNKTFSVPTILNGVYSASMHTSEISDFTLNCLVYFSEDENQYISMPMFNTENKVSMLVFTYNRNSGLLIPFDNSNLFDDCEIVLRRIA